MSSNIVEPVGLFQARQITSQLVSPSDHQSIVGGTDDLDNDNHKCHKNSFRKSSVFIFPILKLCFPASSTLVWTIFSCSGFLLLFLY